MRLSEKVGIPFLCSSSQAFIFVFNYVIIILTHQRAPSFSPPTLRLIDHGFHFFHRAECLAGRQAGSEPGAYLSTKPPLGLFQGRKTIFSNTSAAVNFGDSGSGIKGPEVLSSYQVAGVMDATSDFFRQKRRLT